MTQTVNTIFKIFKINSVTKNQIIQIMVQFKSVFGWDITKTNIIQHIKEYVKYSLAHACDLSPLGYIQKS